MNATIATATSNGDAGLCSEPGQGSLSQVRGATDSRSQERGYSRSQQKKQKSNTRQYQGPKYVGSHKAEHPKKIFKTADDPNLTRRQRNLKNLMMLNRLETNIGRLEAHLRDLGFDLDNERGVQSSPQPAVYNPHTPPSPCISESENIMEGDPWSCGPYPEDIREDSGARRTAPSSVIDRERDVHEILEASRDPFSDDFGGLLMPRCIIGSPTARDTPFLSREGLQWMSQKAGMTPRLSSGIHSNATSFGISDGDFPRKAFCPLPSKEEASSLLYDYLHNFNCLCPLFEQAKLISLFNEDNLDAALRTPSCWASVNVVFALGIASRIKNRTVAHLDHQRSWLFIKNALGTFHDLCLGQPDLWSIQALLGMSIFFLGTMSAEPCCFLVAAAIRISEQLGLGRLKEDIALSSEDMEHRRRIFWIAYCLDREISIRYGRPPTQSDEDMSIDLPAATLVGDVQLLPSTSRHGGFDAFRANCRLATIKGRLYKDLYSAAAKDRPLPEIMASVGTLDRMLRDWREDLPSECRPGSHGLPSAPQSTISLMLLYLHYSYFNCIIAMHRLIVSRGIQTSEDLLRRYRDLSSSGHPPCTSKVFESESLCANAARASIRLMRYMPEGHISLVGILIHYPIVALTTLSSIIIRNPLKASRLSDMRLMDQVETYLSSLVVSIPNQVIGHLRAYCANYRAAASAAIRKALQFRG
ncbi:fungal-specific transcription factor domain-containing protein [Aspergillus navahoensis]